MTQSTYKIIGYILIVIGVAILAVVGYDNSPRGNTPLVFSEKSLLQNVWINYKRIYINASNRTLDPDNNNITTSEGQSYSMLRAVWMDDKDTFDKVLKFSQDNLQRPNDHLFSWLYGQHSNGTYGVLTDQGGQNTASDADTDTAMALIFASNRWNDKQYLETAANMINDIWNEDVFIVNGKPYMGADNFEHAALGSAVVNPSYFSPAAYRIFATVDTAHDWNALATDSYDLIQKSASSTLDKTTSDGLPPNWFLMNKSTGELTVVTTNKNLTTDYGYDSFRLPWRLALDWQWYKTPEAKTTLQSFSFLGNYWDANSILHPVYSHDGKVSVDGEAPAMYGGSIGYFMIADSKDAKNVYINKLTALYNPDKNAWTDVLSYYDDNWAWFGIALYNNLLPNLAPKIDTPLITASSTATLNKK